MKSGEAGYTLVEMLAALAVISLAFAGLGQGVHILGRYQNAASSNLERVDQLGMAQDDLQAALAGAKTTDVVQGDAGRVVVRCPPDSACGSPVHTHGSADSVFRATHSGGMMVLTPSKDYAFSYRTTAGSSARWPARDTDALIGIAVTGRAPGAAPTAYARLREQQDFHCIYDVIVASCRDVTP